MKRGKYERVTAPVHRNSRKLAVLLLALVMLVGATFGGTLAYLTDITGVKTNAFVVGKVGELELSESANDYAYKDANGNYIIIPGVEIKKDPKVIFKDNNIDAYIFVEVEASEWTAATANNVTTYTMGTDEKMKWTVDSSWTNLENVDGVFYRTVTANAAEANWPIISGNTISVSSNITESTISQYASSLTFTAYAIQKGGFEDNVAGAWAAVKNAAGTN